MGTLCDCFKLSGATAESTGVTDPERWYHWGPYLSERQRGTVLEDYSEGGTAYKQTAYGCGR